jgi:hypothetical protein
VSWFVVSRAAHALRSAAGHRREDPWQPRWRHRTARRSRLPPTLYIDASATGDAAKLEEAFVDGAWMYCVPFVDRFALAKIDGTWKIVNKLFAHTGGEMPAG